MKRLQSKLIAAAVLSSFSLSALAATDGLTGTTSQGSFDMSLTIPSEVQITKLQDVGVEWLTDSDTTTDPTEQMHRQTNFCVYSSAGPYALTVTSTNGVNQDGAHTDPFNYALKKSGDSSAPFSYYVDFTDHSSNQTVSQLQSGTKYTGFEGSTDQSCSGGTNASFDVHIRANDNKGLSTGVYYDTLNVMVSPS